MACLDVQKYGKCPRKYCQWCGTNTLPPGSHKKGEFNDSTESQCMDKALKGYCPRKYCRWCGTATLPPGSRETGESEGGDSGGGALGSGGFGGGGFGGGADSQCKDKALKGYCPRKFCRWCGTATLPPGGKGRGDPLDTQCADKAAKGYCPRKFCRWCGTMTKGGSGGSSKGAGGGKGGEGGKGPGRWVWQPLWEKQPWKAGGRGLVDFPKDCKVWCGNLAPTVTYKELQQHLSQAGTVKWVQVMDGKLQGTGGAAFSSSEEANNALLLLNGTELEGNPLVLDLWQGKE